jgi:hypothetical protein
VNDGASELCNGWQRSGCVGGATACGSRRSSSRTVMVPSIMSPDTTRAGVFA